MSNGCVAHTHWEITKLEAITDKPLVDALMVNGGVPREQIVLAYAGEPVPKS